MSHYGSSTTLEEHETGCAWLVPDKNVSYHYRPSQIGRFLLGDGRNPVYELKSLSESAFQRKGFITACLDADPPNDFTLHYQVAVALSRVASVVVNPQRPENMRVHVNTESPIGLSQ